MNLVMATLVIAVLPSRLELAFQPMDTSCRLDARLPESIARYLPRLQLGPADNEAAWRLEISSRAGQVEMVLHDDRGALKLRRVLQVQPIACAARADGIALILERYLRDLEYDTGFEPLPSASVLRPNAPLRAKSATVASAPPRSMPVRIGMDLTVGGSIEVSPSGPRFGGQFDLGLTVEHVRVELGFFGLALAPGTAELLAGGQPLGEYRVWSLGGVGRAGGCFSFDPLSFCLLAGGGFEHVQARTTGDRLFIQNEEGVFGGLLVAGIRADWSLGPIFLYFRAEALIRPRARVFLVEFADDPYRVHPASGFLSVGGAVKLF